MALVRITVRRTFLGGLLKDIEVNQSWKVDAHLVPSVGQTWTVRRRAGDYVDRVLSTEPVCREVKA